MSSRTPRVTDLTIRSVATHQQPEYGLENDSTEYDLDYGIQLEAVEDPRWRGPEYVTPRHPVRVLLDWIPDTPSVSWHLCT